MTAFPNPRNIPWILAALAFAMAPLALRIPAWITVGCLLCWGYLLGAATRGWALPGRVTRLSLTLGSLAGVMLTTGPGFDRETGMALFAVTAALKPMEIKSRRDETVSLFMAYFLVLTGLFFSGTLLISLHMLAGVFLITAVLIRINHPDAKGHFPMRLAGAILLQALPIAAALFLLFPRIQGNLWSFSKPKTGLTGFSDRMAPGDISSLVQSRQVAFRVEFQDAVPSRDRLYWRGIVFGRFDGRQWHRSPATGESQLLEAAGKITYTITLEPHQQRWLFALDLPLSLQPLPEAEPLRMVTRNDFTLARRRPVRERIRYRISSATVYRTFDALQTPKRDDFAPWTNPRAADLARQWKKEGLEPEQIVQAVLDFFKTSGFVYSLNAPLLGRAPVDEFLFRTRTGYCEHYASAMAYLLRAAGVKARVVGGYLGGEKNPFGDYLIVRQSDAHAWVEALLPGKGWARIDPTSVVAPARISQGAAQALPPAEAAEGLGLADYGPLSGLIRGIDLGWDAVNSRYHRWITGYSFQRQKRLLARLGIPANSRIGPLGATLLGVFLACLLGWVLYRKPVGRFRRSRDRVQAAYLTFCRKLARAGLPRPPGRGPRDHAREVAQSRDDLAEPVLHITDLYVRLRYAPNPSRKDFKMFQQAVSRFRPGQTPPGSGKREAKTR